MNSRVRDRGFTAKEMAINRDQLSNEVKPTSDQYLSTMQTKNRTDKHKKPKINMKTNISIGDNVYVKNGKSKNKARETYKVTKLFTKEREDWAIIQKNDAKFMSKEYEVKITEIFPAFGELNANSTGKSFSAMAVTTTRQVPKAPNQPRDNDKQILTTDKHDQESPDKPLHGWIYSDWLKLIEEYDDVYSPPSSEVSVPATKMIKTPHINSLLRFTIQQRNIQDQTSSALLQRFLPEDEPEILWDHSPEFLSSDNHTTWKESLGAYEDVEDAIAPRQLFTTSESVVESLTSMDSDDSLFFNQDKLEAHQRSHLTREDKTRQAVMKKRRWSFHSPLTRAQLNSSQLEEEHPIPHRNEPEFVPYENPNQEAIANRNRNYEEPTNLESNNHRIYSATYTRSRRKNRKVMDYRQLHNVGFPADSKEWEK